MFNSFDLLLIVRYFLTGYSVKIPARSFPVSVVEHNQSVNISRGQLSFALLFFNTVSVSKKKKTITLLVHLVHSLSFCGVQVYFFLLLCKYYFGYFMSLLHLSVFHVLSMSLDLILQISTRFLVPLVTLSMRPANGFPIKKYLGSSISMYLEIFFLLVIV